MTVFYIGLALFIGFAAGSLTCLVIVKLAMAEYARTKAATPKPIRSLSV